MADGVKQVLGPGARERIRRGFVNHFRLVSHYGHQPDAAHPARAGEVNEILSEGFLVRETGRITKKNADLVDVDFSGVIQIALGFFRIIMKPVFEMVAPGGAIIGAANGGVVQREYVGAGL